jgi:hypothetical protein
MLSKSQNRTQISDVKQSVQNLTCSGKGVWVDGWVGVSVDGWVDGYSQTGEDG